MALWTKPRRSVRGNPAPWLVALGLGIAALTPTPAVHAQQGQPPAVIVAEARMAPWVDRVEALGTLRANEAVDLTAPVTEKITALFFDDGQMVEAGAVLVEMKSVEQAALLDEARAALADAQRQYDRAAPLAARGVSSDQVLDERRAALDGAKARLRAIESRLADRVIRAPFTGVVGLRNISVGALVRPGDVIVQLLDVSVLKLDFSVPATFLSTLKPGLKIEAKTSAYPGRVFEGLVASLDPQVDPVTRSITVRARIPNPDGSLKPGLLMVVELFKSPRETIVIPEEALMPQGRDNFVLAVVPKDSGMVAERRKLTLGERRPGEVEVLNGLAKGDKVITHGTMIARPGQPVTIQSTQKPEQPISDLIGAGRKGGSS